MTDKNDEWGPWIKHDGKGCPVVGLLVRGQAANRSVKEGIPTPSVDRPILGHASVWVWDTLPDKFFSQRIVRYRIRRSPAVREMIERARDLDHGTAGPEWIEREIEKANG